MRKVLTTSATAAIILGTAFAAVSAPKPKPIDTSELRQAVEVGEIREHQAELQEIADENDGTRVSGTPGYDESADYVVEQLKGAGYKVTRQSFEFPFFQELSPPLFQRLSPDPREYSLENPVEFGTMQYSGSGNAVADIQAVDVIVPIGNNPPGTSNSGCETEDFAAFISGRIALIQRGTCTFQLKAENAQAAGAIGVIIFNEGQPGRTDATIGTLGAPTVTIPVIGTTYDIGAELYNLSLSGPVTVQLTTDTLSEIRLTENILADKKGDANNVVVVGAHLDSVAEGPGINDNGSGTGAILEIAIQIAEENIKLRNKLRFAFWGAEESGLLGSEHYVANLSEAELAKIRLNLNFDMLGSPNFVRFVYDGDGSDTPQAGPPGSDEIEQVFLDYFAKKGLQTEPTAFDGRSDYGPFIDVGIPAGGLFSGAEGIKTPEQAAIYRGTAGVAYDPCYHQACDTFANVSRRGLHQLANAAAHAVQVFAQKELAPPAVTALRAQAVTMDYRGPFLVQ